MGLCILSPGLLFRGLLIDQHGKILKDGKVREDLCLCKGAIGRTVFGLVAIEL